MSLGSVGKQLSQLLRRQLDEAGVVCWFDPQGEYAAIVDSLDLGGAPVLRYEDSFFVLRKTLDQYLTGETPQSVVVYVPKDRAGTDHALVEVEVAGNVVLTGAPSLPRNTRLSVIARAAARATGRWTDQAADKLARDIESGILTSVDEIDRLIEGGDSRLQLIFSTGDPQAIALRFLSDESVDVEIAAKKALPELKECLARALGVGTEAVATAAEFRARLARFVLLSDLAMGIRGLPGALVGAQVAEGEAELQACAHLADQWRNRTDLRHVYRVAAGQVEQELGLAALDLAIPDSSAVQTFACVERLLQEGTERVLLQKAVPALVERARARQSSFWSEADPDMQAQWALIAAAGEVLVEAGRVEAGLKEGGGDIAVILRAYTEGDEPWCRLDTAHRNLEQLYQTLDVDLEARRGLEALVVQARQRYSAVSAALAEAFLRAYRDVGFKVTETGRQSEVFAQHVRPHLKTGKVAYVLVDALRYEMAEELMAAAGEDFEVSLKPVLGTVPTITEIGMAALLPGAEEGVEVVAAGSGRLALKVSGQVLGDRKTRLQYLAEKAGVPVIDCTLEELLPQPKRPLKQRIAEAQLVVVTSQEIDSLCEGENVSLARQVMDTLLERLLRGCRVLRNLGAQLIVVVADHGFLFGEEIGSDMKIEAPGGQTVDLHRRVWVGKGGAAEPACMRTPLAALGVQSDLDICVPWSLAAFKVKGGAGAYFHGGMSPQELVIPVLALRPRTKVAPVAGDITWQLIPGSAKISTRFISVQVTGVAAGLLEPVAPKVRVEVRVSGKPISKAVSASYGFEEATGAVQLKLADVPAGESRPVEGNTVALMIIGETTAATANIVLVDDVTGVELAKYEGIELAIAM
ncbi:MAG: PglZ domain-containing protein [Armatimonadetes bacterium]|nr:PglZ domain-containing protein [Armatimonadota bacterium]